MMIGYGVLAWVKFHCSLWACVVVLKTLTLQQECLTNSNDDLSKALCINTLN